MQVDKPYCMSSFLMYRTIADHQKAFCDSFVPRFYHDELEITEFVHNSGDLAAGLKKYVETACSQHKAALALSGGIDSAILAKYMPKGSVAYTFRCTVPGIQVTDETEAAASYARECGMLHRVVEITWEDFEQFAPVLMRHKGAPFHSIEVQIYKAALQAKKDGFDCLIFGESSDLNYGGLSGLLSKDWTFGEFVDRYSYVKPYYALKNYQMVTEPLLPYENNGVVDVHQFNIDFFYHEAMGSYTNACSTAGILFEAPYAHTRLAEPLDLARIRNGENKYLVRELFTGLYSGFPVPPKLPMPRPMDEWLRDWQGPTRPEFRPNCTKRMTGDQKWLVWVLEQLLNLVDEA